MPSGLVVLLKNGVNTIWKVLKRSEKRANLSLFPGEPGTWIVAF